MTNCIAVGVRKATNYIGICKFTRRLIFKHGDYVNIISLYFQDIKTVQKKTTFIFLFMQYFLLFEHYPIKNNLKLKTPKS